LEREIELSEVMDNEVVLASTHLDRQGEKITRTALEASARDINSRPVRLTVEHDLTLPPWGRLTGARVVDAPDGECLLVGTQEAFGPPRRLQLSDGTELFEVGSPHDEQPLYRPPDQDVNSWAVGLDSSNFDDPEAMQELYEELRGTVPFEQRVFGRKSWAPDPQMLMQLPVWLFLADQGRRLLGKAADRVGEDLAEDAHKVYMLLTRAPGALLRRASPHSRPATVVYYVATRPRVEFVVRSTRPEVFVDAIEFSKLQELFDQAVQLSKTLGAVEVQFLYSDADGWTFNYLLTNSGRVVGKAAAFERTQKRLELLVDQAQLEDRSRIDGDIG
jgi:hypothetical protein